MRNELEIIEKIEKYLTGHMSAEERGAFERELQADPELQQKVVLQKELMSGVERIAIKQEIQLAGRNFAASRRLARFGLGGGGLLILVFAAWYFISKHSVHTDASEAYGAGLPAYNEQGGTNWASADSNLPAQVYTIDAARDTVIETEQGIVMAIAANSMLDENKRPIQGQYSLSIKEALDAASIMKAGLSSTSGDNLLESAGMFYIDARKGDKLLSIDPAKGIYAEVPSAYKKDGMQLFSGKRMPDGTIDWVDPKPLIHDLVPVDILSLDFYPPYYLDSVAKWGYNNKDMRFTDSLYYSLAEYFGDELISSTTAVRYNFNEDNKPGDYEEAPKLPESRAYPITDSGNWPKPSADTTVLHVTTCGINPAKINTIWNSKYQNTLLATREFEERLKAIHESHIPILLDLYVNNLDRNMYELDSIAIIIATTGNTHVEKFRAFAARHDGKVNISSTQFKMLSAYYEMKTKAFTIAIAKTQEAYRAQQAEMDAKAEKKKYEHENAGYQRKSEDFEKELKINLKEAYRQLGYSNVNTVSPPPPNSYTVTITGTGWNNVDKYVVESTTNRTTLDYTDKSTGKKAMIKYEPATVTLDNAGSYDRIYVYALPAELNSFVRLPFAAGQYQYKLNELIKYDLFCIAWKGSQAYSYEAKDIKPQRYDRLILTAIANDELDKKLNSKGTGMYAEQDYLKFEYYDQQRQQKTLAWEELRAQLFRMISPCYGYSMK